METLHYVVPATSYPRYDYSKRHVSSMYTRFKTVMKGLNLDSSEYGIPEYGDVDIFVTCGSKTNEYVDKSFLALKTSDNTKIEMEGRYKFGDVGDLVKRKEITDISSRIVVVCISRETELELDKKYPHNVVIVAEGDSLVDKIKQKIATTHVDPTQVTSKKSLGQTICLVLERIVFRNLRKLVPVLEDLSNMAKNECIGRLVAEDMKENMNSFLKNDDCFRGWLEELDEIRISALHPELANYKPTATASHSKSKQKLKYKPRDDSQRRTDTSDQISKRIESGEKRPVPEYLKCVTDIEERYINGSELLYYLVYKLAAHLGVTAEQAIYTEYKRLPQTFRDILRMKTDPGSMRTTLTEHICELLVTCIPSDIQVDDDDTAEDLLLVFLRSKSKHIRRGIKKITGQLVFVQTVDKHQAVVKKEDEISITRLLGDIKGLYNRSKVPQYERPSSGRSDMKRLNEKVAKQLFESVKAAKGCGYRYNKLHIYVEETGNEDEKENIEQTIRKILVHNNIPDYIVSTTTKTTHFKQVGAKIRVGIRNGTLGGFAKMGQQKTLCALLSQHVVSGASEVYLVDKNIQIGSMVQSDGNANENVGYVDVAAAKILDDKRCECVTQFKDSRKNPLPSRLYEFDDSSITWLQGLPVHICGAATDVGKGTVTVPEYHVEGMDEPLVLIEDIEGNCSPMQRFSAMGDSGAVICADDPDGEYVHVVSMLIGCNNFKEIGKDADNKIKGKYSTFRMTCGLNYLEKKTGQAFTLC